jgi:integrase
MIQAGVPLALVSKRLGHSSISITSDVYGHLLEGAGREAAERAAALIPKRPRISDLHEFVTGGDTKTN